MFGYHLKHTLSFVATANKGAFDSDVSEDKLVEGNGDISRLKRC